MKSSVLRILHPRTAVLALTFVVGSSGVASITISISQPAAGATEAESALVQASVSSLYELSFVTAAVAGRQTNLVYSSAASAWTNTISLLGLTRGSNTLTITAQDVFGNTTLTQRVFSVDNPPILVVVAPLNGTVTRGDVYVEATATDDDPAGTVINVYGTYFPGRPAPLLRGTNSVRGRINPKAFPVVFEATDSAGQKRYIPRQVILEPGSNLVETATAPGTILDVTSDRFLYRFSADLPVAFWDGVSPWRYGNPESRILYRASQQTIIAPGNLPTNGPDYGFLASTGAVLGYGAPFGLYNSLIGWPETNTVSYGPLIWSSNDVKVVGDTVCWRWYEPPFGPDHLTLRSISRSNDQFVISFPIISGFDLGPNLDLVYGVSNQVFRSRPATPEQPYINRTTTQLTFAEPVNSPLTDGTNVVFARAVSNGVAIVVLTAAGEETLALWPPSSAGADYRVKNGWVAFTKPGTTIQSQIWTRSPLGTLEQRTFFGSSSTLEALGPAGDVTFLLDGRYISYPGVSPWWICSSQGTAHWVAGKLLLLLGRSTFEVSVGNLSSIPLANGDLKLTFGGPAGLRCSLQASSNLLQWSNVLDFTNTMGTISWTNAPPPLQQYYRSIAWPH